ncbi:hypothetical protein [Jeotgalibacillus soli]|uniref:Uncharacterized protein n=1 Tax=Jeotgalibacillus soli TaxID=889306 RepID=A0A0C2W6A8_9BACL|nr:hypothetical protein [Jeotgalibacillus soli]KIL52106.1 hypothetical protein KP78_04760 [Jeotgalibacillus soli]
MNGKRLVVWMIILIIIMGIIIFTVISNFEPKKMNQSSTDLLQLEVFEKST